MKIAGSFPQLRRSGLVMLIAMMSTGILKGQSNVQTAIQLLTPELVSQAVIEQNDTFLQWLRDQSRMVKEEAVNWSANADLHVLYSLNSSGHAQVTIHTRPARSDDWKQSLLLRLQTEKAPSTKFSSLDFVIMAKVNSGLPDSVPFKPAILYPFEKQLAQFEALETNRQIGLLKEYVRTEVIPLLIYYTAKADEKFLGVRWLGRFLESETYLSQDPDSVLYNQEEYWQALMEMEQGNQLVLFTAMCIHILRGEFDRAERMSFLVSMFSNEENLPAVLSDQINPRLQFLTEGLNRAVEAGIAFHDSADYARADSVYRYWLADTLFPGSAWLHYEQFFTKSAIEPMFSDSLWTVYRPRVLAADPLYPMDIKARNGEEAYRMMLRQSIMHLFPEPASYKSDFVQYADIALDLGVYAFSAQLYWLILTHFNKSDYNNRNLLAHYLYALENLGVHGIHSFFEGNFEQDITQIAANREKLMKESGIYQAFGH